MKDSFDRDADREYAYNCFEEDYIFKNMRPDHISVWEWRVMFDKIKLHTDRSLAVADAKSMAKDMGCMTMVKKSTYYRAYPVDYWKDATHFSGEYEKKLFEFIRNLVINDQYPDISKIAHEENHSDRFMISLHYVNSVMDTHRRWKEEASLNKQNPSEPNLYSK